MTVFELVEILSTADPKAKVSFLPRGADTEDAAEIVAVAMSGQVWVRRTSTDERREYITPHVGEHGNDPDTGRESTESEPVSVVILSTDEDFLFKAVVKKLMLG